MKKLLTMVLAAALTMQCAAISGFATWSSDSGSKVSVCRTDFSGENELDTGWRIDYINNGVPNNVYAEIGTETVSDMKAPYLKIRNDSVTGAVHNQVKAVKEFTVPDGEGIVRTKFNYSSDHGNANAVVRLSDENDKGILIGSAFYAGKDSAPVYIDGELQTPYGNEDNRIYVADLLGTGASDSYAIGNGYTWDLGRDGWGKMWRNFEIVVNISGKKVDTTIAGQNISLGSGIYAVAMTCTLNDASTNILKGVLPAGMGSFSKFSIESGAWIQNGIETRIDDLSVDFEPLSYVNDAEFENWKGVVWGELSDSLSETGANMLINNDVKDMAAMGIGWTRIFVGRSYDADRIDKMVLAANKNDVEVLMTYIKKGGITEYGTEASEAEEMAYLSKLVSRYKGITKYWEIGNEANLQWLDSGKDYAKLENYAKHLRDCYNTIKAADSEATVILGGISEFYAEDWVQAFADVTVDGKPAYSYFDEAAYHPYAETPDESITRVEKFIEAMEQYWNVKLPVWITEVGFHAESSWDINITPGKVANEAVKAEYLTEVMNKLHNKLRTMQRPVMWYILHEKGNTAGYGLTKKSVEEDFIEKTNLAAYDSMKNLTVSDKLSDKLPVNDTFAGATGTVPGGWTSNLAENTDTRYVAISNDGAYLKIHKYDESSANEIVANREFEMPAYGGLISLSFDYLASGERKGYGKRIVLMNDDAAGIVVENGWYNSGNNIAVIDMNGGNAGEATVIGDEVEEWRHFDFVVNCSDATLGGLNAGEYTLSYNNGESIKGKMKNGLKTINKIMFTSGAFINSYIGIDNLSISVKDVPDVIEVNSAKVIDGKAIVEFDISKSAVKTDIIIAAYNTADGRMNRIVYLQPGYLIPKGTSKLEASLGETADGEAYKVFVFDSTSSIKPVMNCMSIN